MQHLAVRRLSAGSLRVLLAFAAGWGLVTLVGCGGRPGPLRQFLDEPAVRRALLIDALWSAENDYARLRTARYASGGERDWTRLPRFLPATAPVLEDGRPPSEADFHGLDLTLPPRGEPEGEAGDESRLRAALRRIGEEAFFTYPAQLVSGFERVATDAALARTYGLWVGRTPDGRERLGGLLRVRLPGGELGLASSCSTCHADAVPQGSERPRVRAGAANAELDIGKLVADAADRLELPEAAWGPGRLDTSPDDRDNPAAIPDLRVVAGQRYLHHDATLRSSPLALALRIETLLITGYGEGVAPPIEVALGLALYLWELSPAASPTPVAAQPGLPLFAAHCARCHGDAGYAGEPVPIAEIGTDPALGLSRERGTGAYRVPTLRGVAARRQLFHDGSLSEVSQVLDPARLSAAYRGGRRGPGAIPGHIYGLELSASERSALVELVRTF